MSKKKRNGIIIGSVAGVLVVVLLILMFVVPDSGITVNLVEVKPRAMSQHFTTTGEIVSDGDTQYTMYSGTLVKTVNVKEGDTVKKGDVLATFDTSAIDKEIAEKQESYSKALESYNSVVNGKVTAEQQVKNLTSQIATLEKEAETLKKELTSMSGTLPEVPNVDIDEIIAKLSEMSPEELQAALTQILNSIPDISTGADKVSDFSDKISKLITCETELLQLKVQNELFKTQSSLSFDEIVKMAVDTAKADLDKSVAKKEVIAKGWVAESDGLVTKVSVKAGETFGTEQSSGFDMSSLLSMLTSGDTQMDMSSILSMLGNTGAGQTGMVVADTSKYVATFIAGKYDILKLEVGQKATVTTMGGTFDGEIIYISPTATSGSSSGSFDLSSITSGLTGSSSAGCQVKVSIENPDESVIEGFDVDIDVEIGETKEQIAIPVEALIPDSKASSVYVYNSETETVSVREITFGTTDDTYYQIESGLQEGEFVVKNPPTTLTDGAKVKVEKNS